MTSLILIWGCPVPKVAARAQAGAALLKDPDKIYEIVKAVKEAVDKPVTVKIRTGWDEQSINAVAVAKKLRLLVHQPSQFMGEQGLKCIQVRPI